jgi:hypothetical protein
MVAAGLLLNACSHKEPPPPDPNALPTNYKVQVSGFLRTYLTYPAKLRNTSISDPTLKVVGSTPHYVACVRYSERDARNQYQPIEEKAALFLAGSLNQFVPATRELCGNAAYQPFPEAEAIVP